MNPIESLRSRLAKRFPNITVEIDEPADPSGLWHLDIRPGGDVPLLVVEWSPTLGFGVSTATSDDFGEKPDELYPNVKAAFDRVAHLVLTGGDTDPPSAVRLAELRQSRGLTQVDLAALAGIGQPALARIEGRDDILLSTLNRVVAAMGGRLVITAEFPDGARRELTGLVTGDQRSD